MAPMGIALRDLAVRRELHPLSLSGSLTRAATVVPCSADPPGLNPVSPAGDGERGGGWRAAPLG
jgi:hypothetical protein